MCTVAYTEQVTFYKEQEKQMKTQVDKIRMRKNLDDQSKTRLEID